MAGLAASLLKVIASLSVGVTSVLADDNVGSFTRDSLPPFSAIEANFPYYGYIRPSPDETYSLVLYAPANITAAAKADVTADGILKFVAEGYAAPNFTHEVYNYTMSVPMGSLSNFSSDVAVSVNMNGTTSNISSFDVTITAPSGSGRLGITDLSTKLVNITTEGVGTGMIAVTENTTRIDYNITGSGSASVNGMTGTINAYLNGPSSFTAGPSSNSLVLNAFLSGSTQTKVTYYTGSCSLISTAAGGSCIRSTITSPSVEASPSSSSVRSG